MPALLTIALVIDTYGTPTNGTTITAMRTAEGLRRRGHRVHVITGSSCEETDVHTTGYRKTPLLYQVCKSQGMPLAKANDKVYRDIFSAVDVVHFFLPFKHGRSGKRIADRLGVPSCAAFHVQPENITSTLHMEKIKPFNASIYRLFKRFYDRFQHVHCPSNMIANELRRHDYQAKLHVVSNGVDAAFKPTDTAPNHRWHDKHVILMIGRLSREKRQDLLIEAVKQSKHAADIQLVFAGQGPWRRTLEKMGKDLPNPPMFDFFTQEALVDIIQASDLYVHASDVEIEAISCIEAFSCGVVPIISDSKISATNQFALSDANLFHAGDATSLSARIDRWLEHPNQRRAMRQRYIEYGRQFTLDYTIDGLEAMYHQTIDAHKTKARP